MSIFSDVFAVYERLASAKMNLLKDALNSHTHDGINGIKIPFRDLYDHILDEQFTDNSINGDALMTNTIPATKIIDYSITMQQIDRVSSNGLKFSTDGYAVYAP